MAKRFPIHPAHPERTCWGCDRYCAADALICGNGSVRTTHPMELFGDDWADWDGGPPAAEAAAEEGASPPPAAPTISAPDSSPRAPAHEDLRHRHPAHQVGEA